MSPLVDVILTPAELERRCREIAPNTVCVVLDVLRATSTIVTALHHGATRVIVVGEIEEALAVHQRDPDVLLAGERQGRRILAAQTGGRTFHLGNSPCEFTPDVVRNRTVVMTTTNGTRALHRCVGATHLFAGSFLNLSSTATRVSALHPLQVLLVCAGTAEQASFEDTLAAGALCMQFPGSWLESASDACLIAMELHARWASRLEAAFARSRNGRRLNADPALKADVRFCARQDVFDSAVRLQANVATLDHQPGDSMV